MTADPAWIAATLAAARPRAVAALLRRLRDLDAAEEAFQEAGLRALQHWPQHGPPRDPLAWLILVGRNAGVDELRRRTRCDPLPEDDLPGPDDDPESSLVERIDHAPYRDDVLRLLFTCCHPVLGAAQRIALALRVVCGLTVREIAAAFLVSEAAMEQRLTRAKRRIADGRLAFEAPGAAERGERLAAVLSSVYLLFNEGYAASAGPEPVRRTLCEEAIRLARLLAQMAPDEPEAIGLAALLVLQHARAAARFDGDGNVVLLADQDRRGWDRTLIDEGLAGVERALRQGRPGPYQLQAAIAATHARAPRDADTDWAEIDRLYAALQALAPSPVVTLNRAVAVARLRGPDAALAMIEPLAEPLAGYFHHHGLRGALLAQRGDTDAARAAFERAIALARTAAEAAHIRGQLDGLAGHTRVPGRARPIA